MDEPQSLHLPRPVWIALALIAVLAVAQWLNPSDVRTLDFLNDQVVRFNESEHQFPLLGVAIRQPAGWTYLSKSGDQSAKKVTFVNQSDCSLINVSKFQFVDWPPVDRPLNLETYGDVEIEWFTLGHRRVGRLKCGDVDLCFKVITHRRDSQLTDAVREFCRGLWLLDTNF